MHALGAGLVRAVWVHEQGPYGVAEMLSKAKNTSVDGLVEAGFLEGAHAGKVRLLRPERAADRLGPGDRQTPDRLGRGASPDPHVWKQAAKAPRRRWPPSWAARPRSPASWPTVSTPSASARSVP